MTMVYGGPKLANLRESVEHRKKLDIRQGISSTLRAIQPSGCYQRIAAGTINRPTAALIATTAE